MYRRKEKLKNIWNVIERPCRRLIRERGKKRDLGEEPAELAASRPTRPASIVDRRLVENAALDQADRAGNDRGGPIQAGVPGAASGRQRRHDGSQPPPPPRRRRRTDVLAQRRARWQIGRQ